MDLIATHLNADFDGLASMVAARKLYPDAALVLPGGAQEALRAFLAVHDLGLTRLKDLALEQVTRLIVVDTREADRLGPLKDLCGKPGVALHVYDHHPDASPDLPADQGGSLLRADLSVNEPVGATTTLLVERLRAGRHALTPFEATVLALGLYEETGSMSFTSTTPRDLEAAAFLLQAGADLTVVNDTLRRPLDPEQIAILNDLLANREVYYLEGRKVLVAASTFPRYRSDLADVVQKLAEMEGLDAVIVAVAMEEKVELIGRSRRPEAIDVARLLAPALPPGLALARVEDMPLTGRLPQPVAEDFLLDLPAAEAGPALEVFCRVLAAERFLVVRETKKGPRELDARPFLAAAEAAASPGPGRAAMLLTLDWQSGYVSPLALVRALLPDLSAETFLLTKVHQRFGQ